MLFGALETDVGAQMHSFSYCPPLGNDHTGFIAPTLDAQPMHVNDYDRYILLAQVGDFLLVRQDSFSEECYFIPKDHMITLPNGSLYGYGVFEITLTHDTPVTISPDPTSRQTMLLYEGVSVNVINAGNSILTLDNLMLPVASSDRTLGYLQADALTSPSPQPLRVGLLTPTDQADCRHMSQTLHGGDADVYGYGTRVILLGEMDTSYFVQTGLESYGLFDKADITLTDMTLAQTDYALLPYGDATIAVDTASYYRPYYSGSTWGDFEAGTTVSVLSKLGDWYCVRYNFATYFFPAEVLSGLPDKDYFTSVPADIPSYQGINNHFRDEPFAFCYAYTPPLLGTDTDVWLFLRAGDQLYLSHRQLQGDIWVETSRTNVLLAGDSYRLTDFYTDGQQCTLELYIADNPALMTLTIDYIKDDWHLASIRLTELDSINDLNTLSYDRLFTPDSGSLTVTEHGQSQLVPLDNALETDISNVDAPALLALCEQAYQQLDAAQ